MAEERSEHAREAAIVAENCMLVSALAVGPEMANNEKLRLGGAIRDDDVVYSRFCLHAVNAIFPPCAHHRTFGSLLTNGEERALLLDSNNAWCGTDLIAGFSSD